MENQPNKAGFGTIWTDSSDGTLHYVDPSGLDVNVSGGAGGGTTSLQQAYDESTTLGDDPEIKMQTLGIKLGAAGNNQGIQAFRITDATGTTARLTVDELGNLTSATATCDGLQLKDNGNITINQSSDPLTAACKLINGTAAGAIPVGRLVTIANFGGLPRFDQITAGTPTQVPIVGVSVTASSTLGDSITVCIGGVLRCAVQDGHNIAIGAPVEKSPIDDGRVRTDLGSSGLFGVALETVTGNAAGTNLVAVMLKLQEAF